MNAERILAAILDCGYADVAILEDADPETLCDAIDDCREEFGRIDLHLICQCLFDNAKARLASRVEETISNYIDDMEDGFTEGNDDAEIIDQLKQLDPYEDIGSYYNYLDTHVYLEHNTAIYEEYMPEALDEFESLTGFTLERWEH